MAEPFIIDPTGAGLVGGGLAAFFAGMFLTALLVGLAVYIYMALALMTIAKKTDTPNAWLAWIPLANVYLMVQISKTPWWTIFGLLLPAIPILGSLALAALMVYWWWKIAEVRNRPGWFGILMIVPIANLIIPGILAWRKD